jgi:spore maturation protein CgeB
MANSDYNQILNDSKIALVFFSKLNLDTYTRRVFEIPASKTFMLSEYTVDMSSLFIEGKEAEYFRNSKELIIKIEHYLKNEKERIRIAENGYKKVRKDGHEAVDRAKQILSVFENVKGQAK